MDVYPSMRAPDIYSMQCASKHLEKYIFRYTLNVNKCFNTILDE